MPEYKTISRLASAEFVEHRSRFIGTIKPVMTEDEALQFINEQKQKYWDATHNVYAYVLRQGNVKRYSDDGEPHSTAGVPALDVLEKEGLTDCVVVITRYFGGVLLGTGGLVRAYSQGVKAALNAGGIVIMRECVTCTLECNYTQFGKLEALIRSSADCLDNTTFSDKVVVDFSVKTENLPSFEKELAELFCGSINLTVLGKKYINTNSN
ncbi:MAG: YigZ family protein [Oscillospiraceae bacterium]|nr:YigZ family protein [Oscillospiraceae bacterium]